MLCPICDKKGRCYVTRPRGDNQVTRWYRCTKCPNRFRTVEMVEKAVIKDKEKTGLQRLAEQLGKKEIVLR